MKTLRNGSISVNQHSLEILQMDSCGISTIEPGAFQGFKKYIE